MLTDCQLCLKVALFYIIAIAALHASPTPSYLENMHGRPLLGLVLGQGFQSGQGPSPFFPPPDGGFSFYNYTSQPVAQTPAIVGALIGLEFSMASPYKLQISADYYQPTRLSFSGMVTQGVNLASANQYRYQYYIASHQFLIDGKLLYQWKLFYPYVLASVGFSRNKNYDYSVDIEPPFTTFSTEFQDKINTAFSYRLGFGLEAQVNTAIRLGIGYSFFDFGEAKTGASSIDNEPVNMQLLQSHLYTHAVLAQLTVIL